MKLLTIGLVILFTFISCAQTNIAQGYIKEKNVEGYIFSKEYTPMLVYFDDAKERYTPTKTDVLKAEQLVIDQLININSLVNQGGKCPVIHKSISKYVRQYIGYVDQNGDRILWINYVIRKNNNQSSELSKDVIMVLDGCSNYWNVKVNLNKEKIYDLRINGSA
jgi:hypothetical protein